jgi:hypothetical protein
VVEGRDFYLLSCMEFTGDDLARLGIGMLEKLVSGVILIFIGLAFYKRTKKRQTFTEAKIQKEIKQQAVINEFKRLRNKYSKPLAKNSHSTHLEQEMTNLYGVCGEVTDHCKAFDLKLEPDFNLLMNYTWFYKGVLFCNNSSRIEDEKIPYFSMIQKDGVEFNKESSKDFFFDNYEFFKRELEGKISSGKFLPKYW